MVNLEHKLTVDDLIVEYMICKIENGNESNFLTSEFISFLYYFENQMPVEDSLYENQKLFERFFERKNKHDWSRTADWKTKEKNITPHMEMEYSQKDDDYIIKANYKLSCYDRSVINTYFMKESDVKKIRNIINDYLKELPKRQIDMSTSIDGYYLLMGNYLAAEIVDNIWKNYIKDKIKNGEWPKQCSDIDKYLLQTDLAEIIGLKSIKKELIELYDVISKRISILYQQDNNLKISSFDNIYISKANYKLLINGYDDLFKIAFGPYKSSFLIDMEKLAFTESHGIEGTYNWDEDPDTKTTTTLIGNASVKKLVRSLNKAPRANGPK